MTELHDVVCEIKHIESTIAVLCRFLISYLRAFYLGLTMASDLMYVD